MPRATGTPSPKLNSAVATSTDAARRTGAGGCRAARPPVPRPAAPGDHAEGPHEHLPARPEEQEHGAQSQRPPGRQPVSRDR